MNNEAYDDDQVLEYTQGIRKQLVGAITQEGMPKDKEDRQILLQTLDGMDRAALGNKRIVKDQKIADDDRKAQMLIANMYKGLGNDNPFEVTNVIEGEAREVEVPEILDPEAVFIEGETDIGISNETYEDFAEKTNLDG